MYFIKDTHFDHQLLLFVIHILLQLINSLNFTSPFCLLATVFVNIKRNNPIAIMGSVFDVSYIAMQ